jgi:hypothetical protein
VDLSSGSHNIEVRATVDRTTDSSKRTFDFGPDGGFDDVHCLDVLIDSDDLKPGEYSTATVKVKNCGTVVERNVKVRLEAFDKIYHKTITSVIASKIKNVEISIYVPEDAEGKYPFSARAYSSRVSDTTTRDFAVKRGIPLLLLEPEYRVEKCKVNEISFDLKNTGDVTETFTLSTDSEWVSGLLDEVTLDKGEVKSIKAYVEVPCDAEDGSTKEFTITAKNSDENTVESNFKVSEPWSFPSIPLGNFINFKGLSWLPWLILILIILILILLIVFVGLQALGWIPWFLAILILIILFAILSPMGWLFWIIFLIVFVIAALLFWYIYDRVILEKKRPMFHCKDGKHC